jgi:hypothetical protein
VTAARLVRVFQRRVLARRGLTFALMCLSFLLFGAGTLNLLNLFRLNFNLIADAGLMALADGAAQQLAELVLTLVLSMSAYLVFKACEHRLVHGLTHSPVSEDPP